MPPSQVRSASPCQDIRMRSEVGSGDSVSTSEVGSGDSVSTEPSNPGLRCNFVLLASAQPCIEELLVQAQSLRGPSRQRSDDECASHPLNPPELWGEVLRSHSKLRSITVCAPRVPRLSSRARSVSSAAIAAARGASSSGVSIARSVRSVHRRRVHPSRCRVRRGRPALGPPDSDTAAGFCGPVSRAVGAGRRPLF